MKKIIISFLLIIFLIPTSVNALSVSSKSAILMDEDSGRVLYAKNINDQKLIASITKIMTAVVAIESKHLDDIVTIDDSILDAYGSAIYIEVGEEMSLRDLIYGMMLRSGNDAALAIADYVGGDTKTFVKMMNEKAQELGMKNTSFVNPNGLDDNGGGNISTAYDMALLTKYADSLSAYKKIVGTKKYVVKTNYKTYSWTNKNKLLTSYKYTTGGKTGYTERANRTLVTSASKGDMNLIVVTLDDSNDWDTHKNLYEYGFNNYHNYLVLNKKDNITSDYYKEDLYILDDYYYPLMETEIDNITIKIKLNKLKHYTAEEKVGVEEVYYKKDLVHSEDVFISAKEKNSKKNFWQKFWEWFN